MFQRECLKQVAFGWHSIDLFFYREKGVIVGGLDRGFISIYDAGKLIKGQENPIIFSKDKHTGPVTALDFNPFQVHYHALESNL
jgi:protein transport protein SEC31